MSSNGVPVGYKARRGYNTTVPLHAVTMISSTSNYFGTQLTIELPNGVVHRTKHRELSPFGFLTNLVDLIEASPTKSILSSPVLLVY